MRVPMRSRITIPVFALLTLALSLVFTPTASAEEPGLLYASAAFGTELAAYNLNSGRVRVIGDIGFPNSLALTFCRPGGVPYTIIDTFAASAQLATLDLSTGAATLVGSPLGALGIMGITCSSDGTLYAVGQTNPASPDFNSLYTVDRETGQASRIGSTGAAGFVMALDFAADGTLYGASARSLFRIDPFTGVAAKVVDFVGVTRVMGLAIAKDGTLYISDLIPLPQGSKVYSVDVSTGVATSVLNTGLANVHGIAFKAPGR